MKNNEITKAQALFTKSKLKMLKKDLLDKALIKQGSTKTNIKLGDVGSYSLLCGNIEWYIPELDVTLKGTCGNYCQGCFDPNNPKKSKCYVLNAYTRHTKREDGKPGNIVTGFNTVKLGHAYRTLCMTLFRDDLLERLDLQLTRKKKKFDVVRLNESGEVTSTKDLAMWCELARRHPETKFYLYTKNYDAVREAVEAGIIPANMFINVSIWHEYGIETYKELNSHSNIRAFCLVDDEWTVDKYKEYGIDITSMCMAYRPNGTMDHNVTCDKCKKCFGASNKCVGCYEH